MSKQEKIKRNDICPCGTGKKYKHCCEGKVDWTHVLRNGIDWRPYLSVRGRNIHFVNKIAEALQLNTLGKTINLIDYKDAFTSDAVIKIHEAIMEAWPPNIDICTALGKTSTEVSGLYIGDYDPEYIERDIVRHSIYANKILVVDPFIYPTSVREEYNPLINPAQYRSQTLKNVNFWLKIFPWIEAGIVEVIRTPADFDSKLNWESMLRQKKKFKENTELKKSAEITVSEFKKRHLEKQQFQHLLLSAPDTYIKKTFEELKLSEDGYSFNDFIKHIQEKRDKDPDFLKPFGPKFKSVQIHTITSGASYEIAKLTANMTKSYLVTDLLSKWKEIELDRKSSSAENKVWTPFAKAMQNNKLKYLNGLNLEHALILRKEGRLESFRIFLRRVWKDACDENSFDETNSLLLSEELHEKILEAEEEWKQIDKDLLKVVGTETFAALLAAGPLISTGQANFLAAAVAIAGVAPLVMSTKRHADFPDKFPAAFFMKLDKNT